MERAVRQRDQRAIRARLVHHDDPEPQGLSPIAQINPSLPTLGGARGDGETNLRADVVAILNEINGNLDSSNIKDGMLRATDLDSAGVVTALPSGYDGQEINYLADATNGVVWRLKYRVASASTYKWELVGGAPLSAEVLTNEARTPATYADLTTVGPSIVVPLAGDYDIQINVTVSTPAASGATGVMSIQIGATAASDNDSIVGQSQAAVGVTVSPSRTMRRTVAAATTTVKAVYRGDGTSGASFIRRGLTIRPVRVG